MEIQQVPLAVVILNACPQPALREARAKILREAGYYPASAGTAEDASRLGTSVICSVAIICQSFTPEERRLIQRRIEKVLPATRILHMSCRGNNDSFVLLSSIRDLLGEPKDVKTA
jgi:hypothetical protein